MPARDQHEQATADSESIHGGNRGLDGRPDLTTAFLYLTAGVPLFLFLFSFLSPRLMLAELAVNFQVQWFAGLLLSGLLLLGYRRWWMALVVLLASAAAFAGIMPVYFPDPGNPQPASARGLRVMSYNVLVHNRRAADVVAEIRRHNPDVLVIIEYTHFWKQALQELCRDYPHALERPRTHGFGIALFSKLPLRALRDVPRMPEAAEMPVLRATVELSGRPLEIVAAHLINPLGNSQLALRDRQFKALAEELVSDPCERVVVGDFNCTTWSQDMRQFLARTSLRDSRQGFGLQPSWSPDGMPFLAIPIDHALVTPGVSVLRRQVGAKAGSDHRPVIIDLAWPAADPVAGK